jgi:rhodanese-related sulfurtransferase
MNVTNELQGLSPVEVYDQLLRKWIVLIDVREPEEYAKERIRGALLFPLSTFDAHALPVGGHRRVVFHCGTGRRSAAAVRKCQDAGVAATAHLSGGLQGWKVAQLPTIVLGTPATGSDDRLSHVANHCGA